MEIIKLEKKELNKFIDFADELYKGDEKYVPFMRGDLKKNLKKLVFEDKTYTALLAVDGPKVLGRVLFTIDKNKQIQSDKCGFFYLYECVDDTKVSHMLLTEMKKQMKEQGAEYASGSFFPFDPDNRRGILVEGFDRAPLLFTSYNKPYYDAQIKEAGFEKELDTLAFSVPFDESAKRAHKIGDYAQKKKGFHIEGMDVKNPERSIDAVYQVMKEATTEINYQEAPSKEEIRKVFMEIKNFVEPSLIITARRDSDDRPLGILISFPDFFQVIRKMKGRLNPLNLITLLTEPKKIKTYRGMLQYVIPEYQKLGGVLPAMYAKLDDELKRLNFEYFEAGTIIEDNTDSVEAVKAFNSSLARRHRIYIEKL